MGDSGGYCYVRPRSNRKGTGQRTRPPPYTPQQVEERTWMCVQLGATSWLPIADVGKPRGMDMYHAPGPDVHNGGLQMVLYHFPFS